MDIAAATTTQTGAAGFTTDRDATPPLIGWRLHSRSPPAAAHLTR
jgi:hypothetical protein